MANTLTPLIPTLIAGRITEGLRYRSAMLGRIHTETIQENRLQGGDTITIPKPVGVFTPTNVGYGSAAAAQDVTIPSVSLTFGYHKEIKIKANELESRITQGNYRRILEEVTESAIEGLARSVDNSLASLYASAANSVGTGGSALTDAAIRSGIATLSDYAPIGSNTTLVVDNGTYFNTLLGIDRYVEAYKAGDNGATLRGGRLPRLYDIAVDWSQNIVSTEVSSVTSQHGMLFDRYAAVIGFMEFNPASEFSSNAAVEEAIVTDPNTGLSMRVQKYYDAALRTGYYQIDVKWGVAVYDANRIVHVLS